VRNFRHLGSEIPQRPVAEARRTAENPSEFRSAALSRLARLLR
jgi:hypothetical protein